MLLKEALIKSNSTKMLARQFWIDHGSHMRLITSAKSVEELNVKMTNESRNATDWVIIDE